MTPPQRRTTGQSEAPSGNERDSQLQTLAENLLAEAKHIDPGLADAMLAPFGSRERDRHERIRDHYIAYGIRHALDNLGLMPDD